MKDSPERLTCHVCGSRIGVARPRSDIQPTCPKNECQLAAAGMISVPEARKRLEGKR